jgi:hypothetical protein
VPPVAFFGINSSGLNLAISLLIVFVVVLYLSLIYWTYADARRRILDPMLIGCATAASLFPFVGTLVYVILRPPEYLEDARERELEIQAAEARLHQLDHSMCPHCDYQIERDFLRCPSCLRKLKDRCASCQRPLDRAWAICPYCEAEVPGAAAPRRSRSRERSVSAPAKPAGRRTSSDAPTRVPSDAATRTRSDAPTRAASDAPTRMPSDVPTRAPSDAPTRVQSDAPTDEADVLAAQDAQPNGAGESRRAAVPAAKRGATSRSPRTDS